MPHDRLRDEMMAGQFAKKYTREYEKGSSTCSIAFVSAALVNPARVKQAFLDHLKYLRGARRNSLDPLTLRFKRRDQRKRIVRL